MRDYRLVVWRVTMCVGLVSIVSACSSDLPVLSIDGSWHLQEQFADDVHLVSCAGTGALTITQASEASNGTGPSQSSASFAGTGGVDTDCMSADGPFNYFGNSTMSAGLITQQRDVDRVQWDALVNAAQCQYDGAVTGDGDYGLEMAGTLTCVLVDPGVTFNFEGTWEAKSSRSAWCTARPEELGCASGGGP